MRLPWRRIAIARIVAAGILGALIVAAPPARAQFSDAYNFLKAVRERDGSKATDLVSRPGSTIVNARDPSTGETALHIVTRARDQTWMGFLIDHDANLNARDNNGDTPLLAAARIGYVEGAALLLSVGAPADTPNSRGETPLIVAVQARDLDMARLLINHGANPRIADHVAGRSALDYANADPRARAIRELLAQAKPQAAKAVFGPQP